MDESLENRPQSDSYQCVEVIEIGRLFFGVLLKMTNHRFVFVDHSQDWHIVTPKPRHFGKQLKPANRMCMPHVNSGDGVYRDVLISVDGVARVIAA